MHRYFFYCNFFILRVIMLVLFIMLLIGIEKYNIENLLYISILIGKRVFYKYLNIPFFIKSVFYLKNKVL